ncbi:hypothetical protein ACFOU2_16410 [Bacillus songklensis]|uniref:Uncharacterized protein n=1 Tax=Bacillus songklensis TaxID=1069116 RepID=A0ABV8B4W8_9BACI
MIATVEDNCKKNRQRVHLPNLPLLLAKQRANERAKITGRKIPPHVIENTHRLVPKTFEAIRDFVDSYHVYDNRDQLVLIASNHFIDSALHDEFLKKGVGRKPSNNKDAPNDI